MRLDIEKMLGLKPGIFLTQMGMKNVSKLIYIHTP